MKRLFCVLLCALTVLTAAIPFSSFAAVDYNYQDNDIEHIVIHDPSIVKSEEGKYYCVGSHLAMGKSDDLINWQDLGHSIEGNNYLTFAGGSWKDTLAEPLDWCMRYQQAEVFYDGEHKGEKKYGTESWQTPYEYNCWANDIIYNPVMGKYCLYGSCSVWGTTASAIWLCVSDNIEGPYSYVDMLIQSGITSKARYDGENPVITALDYHNVPNFMKLVDDAYPNATYKSLLLDAKNNKTYKFLMWDGFYNVWSNGFPNAIDPTAYFDKDGNMWLVYGSFSGGCFVQKLDISTGLVDYSYIKANLNTETDDVYFGKRISNTNEGTEGTGEGPFIVYDKVSGYYYFFLTYGGLASDGGYNIREYRSKSPEGPYVDKAGNKATDLKNTGLKLDGNYKFSCNSRAYLSGGHSSCLVDDDGSIYQAYHTRVDGGGEGFQTRIHKMLRTSDGWAVMMPFEYQGEKDTASVTKEQATGTYEFIDSTNMTQRKESYSSPYSDIILPTQKINLNFDGTITGARDYSCSITKANTGSKAVSGTWTLTNGRAYCNIKLGSVNYTCVFGYQKDESKDAKEVLTFTGAGSDNSTVWGVKTGELPHVIPPKPIVKKANTLIAKGKTATVNYKKLKKKNQSIALKKAVDVSRAQGSVSFKKTGGNKKITVASTGKITVKKKLKKGTYKIKIKVTATGNKYYKPLSKTVTVKIKVK
ncbi:MAG: glycoside hydrolase family 43 protein [Eubacterium sp.]|nr:glycoside hydrolase family 43 protein [Eubacterium sp.]